MKKIITDDGSITFYNEDVGDHYHTKSGAVEESFEKHVKPMKISEHKNPVIFDICFGLGYNAAAAIDSCENCVIYCLENDKEILEKILDIKADFKSFNVIKEFVSEYLSKGIRVFENEKVKLVMVFGNAREEIKKIDDKSDFVFFDAFSPAKVPEMWTFEFFRDIYSKMNSGGKMSTYSCARFVRDNMKKAGFRIVDGPIIGRKSPSTIAIKD